MGLIGSMELGPGLSQAGSTKPGSYKLTQWRSKQTEPSAVMAPWRRHHGDVTSLQPGDATPDEAMTKHSYMAFRGAPEHSGQPQDPGWWNGHPRQRNMVHRL